MRGSNPTTLQDVAREAGVSSMTVSVVLNGSRSATRVSEATRARIKDVAARLRYRPNAAARALQRRRTDTIGVVGIFSGYLVDILQGILASASEHDLNTTFFSVSDWQKDERRILGFCDGRADGLILVAPRMSAAFAESLTQHTPFVAVHPADPLENVWRVDVDNEGGAYAVVRHLIEQGHRRILHLAGPLHLSGARERLAGYRRALEDADIPYDDALVAEAGFATPDGKEAMSQLLENGFPEPTPTAVFCANDAAAIGCLEALAEQGLSVPRDMSVGGFDDAFFARLTLPHLTTARQPFEALGRTAVEMLRTQIQRASSSTTEELPEGSSSTEAHAEILGVELVVRASVGPPPMP